MNISNIGDMTTAGQKFGYPFVLKNKRLAYDGRGNIVVTSESEIETCYIKLGGLATTESKANASVINVGLYAEEYVNYVKEIAVMVVRTGNDSQGLIHYPVVETIQRNNICHIVTAPASISFDASEKAIEIATSAVRTLDGKGIYGVEMFLLADDSILLNEIAPRPHNSGHYTMEACDIDQFEMHLRAVLDLPCPVPTMRTKYAVMVNVLGLETLQGTMQILKNAVNISGASIHWYGKAENREGRKMAHITITANDEQQLYDRIRALQTIASSTTPSTGTSATDEMDILRYIPSLQGVSGRRARVAVIMGSDSDLPCMSEAAAVLDHFQIPYELTVVSAHRTPSRMYTYAQTAIEKGIQVIIAGAGGAAHLPGMVAALTPLPVIGVPIKTSTLNGNDSLLSIVQMPRGIPVATVAIGNAANAGLLAVRILGASDMVLLRRMEDYMKEQEVEVLVKAARLEEDGYQRYLENMTKKRP